MVQQITNGIKISVNVMFIETRYVKNELCYLFSYQITIKNLGEETVQLISRHWDIYDALNNIEIVEGTGVIGKQPVMLKNESHTYNSFSILKSPFGAMGGYYKMLVSNSNKTFDVKIPKFQLSVNTFLN